MKEQEKQLLLKDLSARLPYRIKVFADNVELDATVTGVGLKSVYLSEFHDWWDIEFIKPYLRPMSSMTEEERNEYFDFRNQELQRVVFAEAGRESAIAEISDWLNAHHFDYRGLIEKGLALEASEDMYKTE